MPNSGAVDDLRALDGSIQAVRPPDLPEPNPLTPFQPAAATLPVPEYAGAQPDWNGLLGPPAVTLTPGDAPTSFQPVAPSYGSSWSRWGLSSITRNRLANRLPVAPAAAADGSVPPDRAAGRAST
jgi:hypothetical protein